MEHLRRLNPIDGRLYEVGLVTANKAEDYRGVLDNLERYLKVERPVPQYLKMGVDAARKLNETAQAAQLQTLLDQTTGTQITTPALME